MANFQAVPGDKNALYDPGIGRLIVPLGTTAQIELRGGAKQGANSYPLCVDVNDPNVAMVSLARSNLARWTFVYNILGVNKGNAMLEARDFGPVCPTQAVQRAQWFTKRVWAYFQISVVPEYLQAEAPWGSKVYKSNNPMWHHVKWTTMAWAGCGPTSLAIIMDYVTTWDSRYPHPQNVCVAPNITPAQTMNYSSIYGGAADKNLKPQGTSGVTMMGNLGKWWPGYSSTMLAHGRKGVDEAERLLKSGNLLLFLCKNGSTFDFNRKGHRKEHHWGGHFMVLVGVDSAGSGPHQVFFIADPSRSKTRFITRETLELHCEIWRVIRDPIFTTQAMSIAPSSFAARP
jgi:hypothetical protein